MKDKFKILLLLVTLSFPVAANSLRIFTLSADEWARPRRGDVMPDFDALRAAVDYWDKGANFALLIRYPGEDSGEIWASELRDWFISLGIPSDYILLAPGSQEADAITLIIGNRTELKI
jgi:hypothetical protein